MGVGKNKEFTRHL